MRDRFGADLARLFGADPLNAGLAWLGCGLLVAVAGWELARGNLPWGGFVLAVGVLAAVPGPFYRSPTVTLPWELVALVAVAAAWRGVTPSSELGLFALVAGAAVLVAAELHLFTSARMSHRFVVLLVAVATAAVAGAWALASWAADAVLATDYVTTNGELMGDFLAASVAGVAAGLLFDGYVRWWEGRLDRLTPLLAEEGA